MNIRPAIETLSDESAATPWLHGIFAAIRRRWWWPLLAMLMALVLMTVWLRRADYLYTAQLKVYAAPSSSGSRAPSALGGLAALTGLAGGASETVTPFRFYLDGLYGPAVAKRLATDQMLMRQVFVREWDSANSRWRRPPSITGSIRRAVTGLMGLPQFEWTPPGPEDLQAYIGTAVAVRQSVRTPVVTISYDGVDPVMAAAFLKKLHDTTDGYMREQQMLRTRANIDYITGRLQTITLVGQRAALVAQLTEQERQAMLVASDAAYAAEPFDRITVSALPTRPRPVPMLIGAGVAGLFLGAVLAAAWRRRTDPA